MPVFSEQSKAKLETCHESLQELFNRIIRYYDITILEGYRGPELQNLYYEQGKSKLQWPNSNHNERPSMAVDVAPYPIDWSDRKKVRFYYLAGLVKAEARRLGITIRWGGDWDTDLDFFDQDFNDLPHYELVQAGGNDG